MKSRLVLERMDNCQRLHNEHHEVQKPYTDSDNRKLRLNTDPNLEKCSRKKIVVVRLVRKGMLGNGAWGQELRLKKQSGKAATRDV